MPSHSGIPDPSLTLRILLERPGFIVASKPSGMLSVPGIGPAKQVCAISLVRDAFPRSTGPMMVHRLDMETSGLLVVATTPEHQVALSSLFEHRLVHKAYTALLDCTHREPLHDEGTITLPMRLDVDNRPYQIIDHAQGRPACTRYRILSRETDRARVRFEPQTGRTHQLRLHAASPAGLGCPIQGDMLYGDPASAERLMLHAHELSFRDPLSGETITCLDPPPF